MFSQYKDMSASMWLVQFAVTLDCLWFYEQPRVVLGFMKFITPVLYNISKLYSVGQIVIGCSKHWSGLGWWTLVAEIWLED